MKDHIAEKNIDTTKKPILTPMSLPPKLERNSSLDVEPKTLHQDELNLAREAALKIINTQSKEEAFKIMKDHVAEKKNNDTTDKPILAPMPLVPMLERNNSLDVEPKTLFEDELKLAREEALKIINTHSKEEALKIFLAGLKPVTSSTWAKEEDVASSDYDDNEASIGIWKLKH